MNKTFLYLLLSLVLLLSSQSLVAAYNLTEAIERGLEANLTIKAQEFTVQEAEKGKLQAYGNFLPTVSFVRQKTNLTNDKDSAVFNTDYLNQDRIYESMRFSQPIFTGFYSTTSVIKADYILKYQQAELANVKERLVYEVRRQFIQYLKFRDDAVMITASVERLKKQLTAAEAFYERQMAPKLHVIQAEVALAKAQQDLLQVETRQETTRMTLSQLLELDLEQPVNYSGSLVDMDYNVGKTLTEYLRQAKVRPDVKEARLNIEVSKQESMLILSQNMPKISLDVSYNRSNTEYDDPRFRDEDTEYWSSVLNLSMQFFHGGQTITSSMKQQITTKRYRNNLKELLRKTRMDVSNSYASLLEAHHRIDSASKIKEAASRSYERADRRYKSGLGTSVDVLNAQDDMSRSEADIVQARADFLTIKAELDYLSGGVQDNSRHK